MSPHRLLAFIAPTVLGVGLFTMPTSALQMSTTQTASPSVTLFADIVGKLDTKNAQVGEEIAAKTLAPEKLADGVMLPKGAILLGKVTEVQSKSSDGGTASVTISFDQVLPKKKASPISIHGVLVGVAPKPSLSDAGASASSLPTASSKSQATTASETGQSMDSAGGPEGTVVMGSDLKNVTLASGTLTSSHGDIKLDHGTRIAVALQAN